MQGHRPTTSHVGSQTDRGCYRCVPINGGRCFRKSLLGGVDVSQMPAAGTTGAMPAANTRKAPRKSACRSSAGPKPSGQMACETIGPRCRPVRTQGRGALTSSGAGLRRRSPRWDGRWSSDGRCRQECRMRFGRSARLGRILRPAPEPDPRPQPERSPRCNASNGVDSLYCTRHAWARLRASDSCVRFSRFATSSRPRAARVRSSPAGRRAAARLK